MTVERPLRLLAQFTPERVASLRFIPAIAEAMQWVYGKWGDNVYQHLKEYEKEIKNDLEKEEISVTGKNLNTLLSLKKWQEQKKLLEIGEKLADIIGDEIWRDFNLFTTAVDDALKGLNIKLSASEKKQILGAMSWQDESAARVVKKVHKLKGEKLDALLEQLGTTEENLEDFGYFPTDKAGVWLEYESDSNLRDTENVPLALGKNKVESDSPQLSLITGELYTPSQIIHEYFLQEVRPHVEDAWLDLSKTTIGYEISFNKYFYKHQPLRSLEEVIKEILQLEAETEGLLKNLVTFGGVE